MRRRGRRRATTTPTTSSATVNHLHVSTILELLPDIDIATLSCGAIASVAASPRAPFLCIPSQPFNFLEVTPVCIWIGSATVRAHPPPLQCAFITREACRHPIMEFVCGTSGHDGIGGCLGTGSGVRLHQHGVACVCWREIPMPWISVVVWLAVTSAVVWLTITVHLSRPDTLQYVLVEACLFGVQSTSRRTNGLVTKPEHKVALVVRSHPDLELNLTSCFECCNWSLVPR